MEKEEKEIFYNELYELDREDSDEVDTSNASVVLGQSRLSSHDSSFPTKSLHRSRFIHSSHQDHVLGRTVSAPLPRDSKVTRDEANPLETVSLSSFVSSKIQKQMGILSPDKVKQPANVDAVTKDPKQNGKRKRGKSSEPMPESQQIFNGLAFCTFAIITCPAYF